MFGKKKKLIEEQEKTIAELNGRLSNYATSAFVIENYARSADVVATLENFVMRVELDDYVKSDALKPSSKTVVTAVTASYDDSGNVIGINVSSSPIYYYAT